MSRPRGSLRQTIAAFGGCLLCVTAVAACTGSSEQAAPTTSATASHPTQPPEPSTVPKPSVSAYPSVSTADPVTLVKNNAPVQISIEQFTGPRPKKPQGKALRHWIAEPVVTWINDAFLHGDYPRKNFDSLFKGWTQDAAAMAAKDRTETTNAGIGSHLRYVIAEEQRIQLYVFGHDGATGGATAKVQLRLSAGRADGETVHYGVYGRLFLTREGSTWRVFGYDLNRTEVR